MSGALTQLVSKGLQDVYLTDAQGMSLFKMKYARHTNFAQSVRELNFSSGIPKSNTFDEVSIKPLGDLVNYMWLEGTDLITNLSGTVFEFYIGSNIIDSQTFDYMSDIWQTYLSDTCAKSRLRNNLVTQTNSSFVPLHFFFCDFNLFLPLISLKFNECEIRIKWGPNVDKIAGLKVFANYVYLDAAERLEMEKKNMDIIVTQVQRTVVDADENIFNLGLFNHPVKTLFFGFEAEDIDLTTDTWTFDSAAMRLNGNVLFEGLTPTYFHTAQIYYHTKYGDQHFEPVLKTPRYTRYFMFSFAQDASSYLPTGTCNFSRLDNVTLSFNGLLKRSGRTNTTFKVYAVNYNILRVRDGMAGILYSN